MTPAAHAKSDRAPTVHPLVGSIVDVNPCTDEEVTISWDGKVRIQEFADHAVYHYQGDMWFDDGFIGRFNSHEVADKHTFTAQWHDHENGPGTLHAHFHLGIHTTVVDGEVTSDVFFVDSWCTGKP